MKLLLVNLLLVSAAFGEAGYTITNRTATSRSSVTFNLPNFRGSTTSTSASTTSGTPQYAIEPIYQSATISDVAHEVQDLSPVEIGYTPTVHSFPTTVDIAPTLATDTSILGVQPVRDWSSYTASSDYIAPQESEIWSGTTLFGGVDDSYTPVRDTSTDTAWSSTTTATTSYATTTTTSTSTTTVAPTYEARATSSEPVAVSSGEVMPVDDQTMPSDAGMYTTPQTAPRIR